MVEKPEWVKKEEARGYEMLHVSPYCPDCWVFSGKTVEKIRRGELPPQDVGHEDLVKEFKEDVVYTHGKYVPIKEEDIKTSVIDTSPIVLVAIAIGVLVYWLFGRKQ